jgi:hypothetical protein
VVALTEGAAGCSSTASSRSASREPCSAVISSTYVCRNGAWKLVFRQQTPA